MEARKRRMILKLLKEKKPVSILYSAKLSLKGEGKVKTFQDKQNLEKLLLTDLPRKKY